jgi:hypothetical protein
MTPLAHCGFLNRNFFDSQVVLQKLKLTLFIVRTKTKDLK